ncbi:cell division transmembrane protein FtsL [Legionella quinlivanii]|uniref:Cell division protein FtsL n=1 Tax=Legionella quinlivanii TaxID=45073 RepID=A0A0W0XXX2_9GAMM|nr:MULTISPECIES: cell division protein FtsL [Legionella]KTD49123.1 cell division transmembrane protein FtsL [Legionella quinlivanii]MCE3046122.1 cell division protein FtsL [Legionella sp. 16cNR16C]MCW8450219.1 cell division protein FtsL [Legionella quinlivanii]RAP38585.1 cell division protein FtsL [Legionella quinlivanii]SEG43492.1 cell division protein FtsL [Legionella quinlivanii DSM 21216]
MNAAARAINQSNLFTGQLSEMRLSKQMSLIITLLISVLLSALAVVYITNEHRLRFDYLQQLEQNNHQLQLQWGQLLLEQASLATPARVEQLAIEKLRMRLPADKQTFVLKPR